MSLDRMEVGRRRERGEKEKDPREERGESERRGEEPQGRRRRAQENAAALPANSRRPAIFTRPIK